MNIMTKVRDGLMNVVANLGTDRDKAAQSYYGKVIYDDSQLANAFEQSWLANKIVTIPALDACRNWRNWQATSEQIELIEAIEKQHGIKAKLLEAKTLGNLWGGAAVYIGTDGDQKEPLDLNTIKKDGLKYVQVLTRHDLNEGELDQDPKSEYFGKPKMYTLATTTPVEIHPSRLAIFRGAPRAKTGVLTSHINCWGLSQLEKAMRVAIDADATIANVASLVFEAKVDVIKIKDMMQSLADKDYEDRLLNRFRISAIGKGNNGTLILDAEEEYDQKSASFQTLPELIMTFLQVVCGAADIPATRFLGQTPSGLNATAEGDIRNYYDRVSSMQELEIQPALANLDECIIRSALGARPKEIHYEWASLWQVSDKEKAEIGKLHSETGKNWVDTGLFPQEVLAKAVENQAVEASLYPGIEDAMEEFMASNPDYFETEDPDATATPPVTATDATPRTLYVHRKVKNAAAILKWAKSQGFKSTLTADDLHVTLIYSKTPVDWIAIGGSWSDEITIAQGGPRLMEEFDGGAVVLQFANNELKWRHSEMIEQGATSSYDEYQPHITITYEKGDVDLNKVEPYQGEIILGPEVFAEIGADWKSKVPGA